MSEGLGDPVKERVAAHWNRRAGHFDEDFGHSIKTPAERAAWDRIIGLVLAGRACLDVIDLGCGTGFLALELAAQGHRVVGVDFAPAMVAAARQKAAERGLAVRFEAGDAESLPFAAASFGLAVSRHLLWTLPHPEAAIAEWIRMLRPGGRLAIIDGLADAGAAAALPQESAHSSPEYRAIGDRLPFLDGRPRQEIERLFAAKGLLGVGGDDLADLVAAQEARLTGEGIAARRRRRYVVWGDVPV
ncbi:MAG TPA: class I SAM-dependent methyltransferase [Stellaceae bacterium]|nr:class I SAM-dependent methyltransferase [Stellaceae bacterium]